MKRSRWTPNLEKKILIDVVKNVFNIVYDCLRIILFLPNLIFRLRFEVFQPQRFVVFLYISMGNETPTQSQVKLIMKIGLTVNWYGYVSNLMCCFRGFIVCAWSAENEQTEECDATA